MKKNAKKELFEKNDEALRQDLEAAQKSLYALRSQSVTAKLENPSLIGKARRDIARIKTIQRHRSLSASKTAAAKK